MTVVLIVGVLYISMFWAYFWSAQSNVPEALLKAMCSLSKKKKKKEKNECSIQIWEARRWNV